MERDRLKKLIAKYENSETTLKEENELRIYFNSNRIPEDLKAYQLLFSFVSEEKEYKFQKMVPGLKKKRKFAISSIAAILLIAVGLFFFNKNLGTVHDKEQALEKTKETLNLVSQYLNQGSNNLVYLKEFNKTQNKIIQID